MRWSAARIAEVTGQQPPTSEQAAVIEAPLEPLLVVAGAGSGKTATMAARVVYLLANELVAPGEVLGLTFTRKAAAELSERVRLRLREVRKGGADIAGDDRPRIATYNSYAGSIVSDHALWLGLSPDAVHIGEAGRFQIAERVVSTWAGDIETTYKPSTLVDGVTSLEAELQEHGVTAQEARSAFATVAGAISAIGPAPSSDAGKALATLRTRADLIDLVEEFTRLKRQAGVIDFGEEVRVAARIAAAAPEVVRAERSRYRVVLLDEYQDTSIAQVELLATMFAGGHPVTAVGDPHQAIYGWRGAAAGTLFDFPTTFARADGVAASTLNLSTAWRNDEAVLAAANTVAAPLRAAASGEVPTLVPRPGAAGGLVTARFEETAAQEAAAVRAFVQQHRRSDGDGSVPSTAVLCRKRSQFAPIVEALEAAGIPVQVVGLAGLLTTPEIADLWSALIVVHDPGRGDALMRLLTGGSVNLGAADVLTLGEWAVHQARTRRVQRPSRPGSGSSDVQEAAEETAVREEAELASLAEAIDRLPPRGWRDPRGRELSDPARSRVERLAAGLRQLRSVSYLSLPELVTTTEQVLGLDIEVAAHRPGPVGQARRNLDEFTSVAATFASDATDRTLGGFLAWLDAALTEERGLDTTESEPDPAAVQVLTVHAAKGLEWDLVAVPGLVEGTFPTTAPTAAGVRRGSGWLSGAGSLPYELRGDRAHLPALEVGAVADAAELKRAVADFKEREGSRELTEERRLAYVAFTRARTALFLSGSFWRDGKRPHVPSVFLTELVDAGVVRPEHWPEASEHAANPAHDIVRSARWPREPASDRVGALSGITPARDEEVAGWWRDAQLLLAERDAALTVTATSPAHLSASAVVALATDADTFRRDRRRPIPRRPSVQARRGTRFHAWVEQYFGAQALLDTDELPGAEDAGVDDSDLDALIAAFTASRWSQQVPVAIESDIDTPVGGVMIRCRIDAVFRERLEDGGVGFHVVDWKTGTPPSDEAQIRARGLQLVLYRLAWSRYADVPIERVRASFHHVAANLTIGAAEEDPAQVEDLLAALSGG